MKNCIRALRSQCTCAVSTYSGIIEIIATKLFSALLKTRGCWKGKRIKSPFLEFHWMNKHWCVLWNWLIWCELRESLFGGTGCGGQQQINKMSRPEVYSGRLAFGRALVLLYLVPKVRRERKGKKIGEKRAREKPVKCDFNSLSLYRQR